MIKRVLVAAAAILAIAVFSTAADAQQKVRIGYSVGKTGLLAAACPVQKEAYELWRDQVNAKGGLQIAAQGKRMIEFVEYDDASDAAKAVQIYEKLISDDKVDLLLAPCATYIHIAIVPVLEKHGFPVVGNTSISAQVRELKAKNIFFVYPLPDQMAVSLANFLADQKVKSISMIALQLTFSLEAKKFLLPELAKRNIKVAFDQEYPPDVKDMTSIVAGMKRANAEAIVALTYPGDSVLYMTAAREQGLSASSGFHLVVLGPSHPFFVEKFGKNAEGIISLGMYSHKNAKWPRAKGFFDAHVAKYKKAPDVVDTTVGYASAEVLEQAVAKAGIDRAKLRQVLGADTFDTILGPAKFKDGYNEILPAGWAQIQNGINEIVWPADIATGKFISKGPWMN